MARVVVEKPVGVRQVEVPGQEKGVREVARLMRERMAEGGVVLAEGCIAQVAEEDALETFLFSCFRALRYRPENVGERGGGGGFCHPVRFLARDGACAKDRRARPVLSAVVLLLQEKRELRSAVVGSGDGRLSQDDHRHGAFVLQFIRHFAAPRLARASRGRACRGTWAAASARRTPSSPVRRPPGATPASPRGWPLRRRFRAPPRGCRCRT